MNEYVRKRIEEMSIDFTSVQSVVDTEGEIVMAEKIYDTMSQIDDYKKNPERLLLQSLTVRRSLLIRLSFSSGTLIQLVFPTTAHLRSTQLSQQS